MEAKTVSITESTVYNPEIRRYFDTVTWLAEVLDGSMRTPFEYSFDGQELYANDGSPIGQIFVDAIVDAEDMPAHLQFELRRRLIEYEEYKDMLRMMQGDLPNTMIIVSDFPPELMDAADGIGGYNVRRKQAMLRVITRTPAGSLQMRSQSLDGSDRRALEQLYVFLSFKAEPGELLGQRMHLNLDSFEQEFLIDQLMGVYDRTLGAQYGGEWYAGQLYGQRINTYDFVRAQTDLLDTYFYYGGTLGDNRLTRELAAAMKLRFEGRGNRVFYNDAYITPAQMADVRLEMNGAGIIADKERTSFDGCGFSSKAKEGTDAERQFGELGYGNQADKPGKEKLDWKKGVCRIDGCPTRPGQTEVAQCRICRGCQVWFDKGRDPAKIYKGLKRVQTQAVTLAFGSRKQTKIPKAKS